MASKNLEITKEKVLKASEKCPQAKEVLKELFSEAFEGEGSDITEELMLKIDPTGDAYWIDIYHAGNRVGYIGHARINITNNLQYKLEKHMDAFKILRKN